MDRNQVVDLDHYDVDAELAELSRKRYAMPPVAIAALRQAGQMATQRMLNMIGDDEVFEKLSDKDKMKLMELVLDRAYGRAETASTNELANAKLGGEGDAAKQDHAKQLEELEAREQAHKAKSQRRALPSAKDVLAQIDRQHGLSVDSPYLDTETDGAAGAGSSGSATPPRNRPVPPQNVVALRRAAPHE